MYPESVEAAAEKAKEIHHMQVGRLQESLAEIRLLRLENADVDELNAARLICRMTIKAIRFNKRVRKAILLLRRVWRPKPGETWSPFLQESRPPQPSALVNERAKNLALCLTPYLIPADVRRLALGERELVEDSMDAEHAMAEEWLSEFPDIFYGFTIEPPVSLPPRSTKSDARQLYELISRTVVLNRNEQVLLEELFMS